MKILVINPVSGALGGDNEEELRRLAAFGAPGTEPVFQYLQHGPASIESDYEDALATIDTIRIAIEAEHQGAKGIVINCTCDTGLAACREAVSIPVVGTSMASMHLAAQLGHRFSVITFLKRTIPRFEDMAYRWGLGHKLASVRSVEIPLREATHDEEHLAGDLFEAGQACILEDGAHALILGCTAFELVSARLRSMFAEAELPVQLLEPYKIALRQVEGLVSMGLTHSKLTYPLPKKLVPKHIPRS